MAGKTSKFMVGLFVIVGVVCAVIIIIWVGATKYFEKGNMYVTYFDESVQGLQADSTVKYRGVEVGRVAKIRVAPDNRLIAVVMKVNLKDDLPKNTVSQLKVAGITGMVFVELDRRKPDEPDQSPRLHFPSEYPVIPSRPSEVQKILAGVNVMVEKFNQVDFKGISEQLKSTASEIEVFFKGKKMEAILANLEATTASLKNTSQRVDKVMASGSIEDVLAEAKGALKGTRTLVSGVTDQVQGLKLKETVAKSQAIASEFKAISENLRQSTETLESFLSRINDRPSDLLFGKPPKPRFNE